MTTSRKGTILIRPSGFAHVAGETRAFTKKRKKGDVKRKLQKAARRKNRGK
jgi:hypothetical protein